MSAAYPKHVIDRDLVPLLGKARWKKSNGEDVLECCSCFREDRNPSLVVWPSKPDGSGGNAVDQATKEKFNVSDIYRVLGVPDPYHDQKEKSLPAPSSRKQEKSDAEKIAEGRAVWEKADPVNPEHGYLKRKGITDTAGLRSGKDDFGRPVVLVPAYRDGVLVGCEQILDREQKPNKFHAGVKNGVCFQIGELSPEYPVCICEGYATAYHVRQLTDWTVLHAFGEGNVCDVVRSVTGKAKEIIVCYDADVSDKIKEETRRLGAVVMDIPPMHGPKTDWCDIALHDDIHAAKRLFEENLFKARKVEKITEKPKRSILDLVKAPSPGSAVKPEKVWYFPRKHLNLVAADSGMGKSLLVTKVCCDLSIGAPVLEGNSEPIRKTLYLNGECGRDYFDWRFLSSGWKYSEDHFRVLHQEDLAEDGIDLDLDTDQGRRNLEILLDGIGPDLLVIDSLPAFSNEDLNDGTVQNEIGKYLKALAIKYNIALVLVTHLRKRRLQDQNTEPTLSEIQGSNAAAKLCNVALAVFEKVIEIDGEERTVKVCKSVKSWGRAVAPFGFCFPELDEESLQIEMVDLPRSKQLTGSWEKVKDALGHTEFTRQAVESVLGVSDRTAKGLLSDWKQQGKIESIGRGPKTVYLVRNGQSGGTLHISSPIRENPVIASIESVKRFFTDTSPQGEDESVKNTFTDSNPVISMIDDVSVKYIDGASPIASPIENPIIESVKAPHPCGNLERFNLPMNRSAEPVYKTAPSQDLRNRTDEEKIMANIQQKAPDGIVTAAHISQTACRDRRLVERILDRLCKDGELEYLSGGVTGDNPTYRRVPKEEVSA